MNAFLFAVAIVYIGVVVAVNFNKSHRLLLWSTGLYLALGLTLSYAVLDRWVPAAIWLFNTLVCLWCVRAEVRRRNAAYEWCDICDKEHSL